MSKMYPECPLYNHDNCKDFYNPKLCAIVRKDKKCIKKNPIPEETETEMLNTMLPKGLIERVKIFCDEKEMTIQDFVTDAILDKLALVHKERRKRSRL
jgi:hypothetical protein